MALLFVLSLLAAASFHLAAGQTPIPYRPLGFVYQTSSTPKVVIEAFYDHLCDGSKANWPILKEVLSEFAKLDVTGVIHIFPLPYHHNAYFMQQAGVVIRQTEPDMFVDYLQDVFADQNMFLTGAVNMTEPEVQNMIAQYVNTHTSVPKNTVLEGFTDANVTLHARYAWKYAASRTISGTPQFIVNGVVAPQAPGYTKQQWEEFVSSLLKYS